MTDEDYDIDGLGHLVTEPTMFGGVKMNPWTYRDMVDDFVQEAAVREFHAKAAIVAL